MKLLWVAAGFAAGYVMGAKAGQERYEQIRRAASDFAHTPVVADVQAKAKELAGRGAEAMHWIIQRKQRKLPVTLANAL